MFRNTLIILFLLLTITVSQAETVLNIGEPPPPLSLTNLKGTPVSLKESLGKETIILSFFASWSKSCQAEIAFLQALAAKHKPQQLKIIAVSFDRKISELQTFITQNNLDLEFWTDKKLVSLKDYRILILPTLFIIDRNGNLKNTYVDFDDNIKQAVEQEITTLLAK